jgi:opine dehydrogenase
MDGAALVLAVVPASAHRRLAAETGPFLEKNAVLVLNPGRSFGALEAARILKEGGRMNPVAETQTLLFACRRSGPCSVRVSGVKETLTFGVFPSSQTENVRQRLTPLIPQLHAAPDVRSTSMGNIGAVFHPAALLLNIGLVESNRDYEFYRDGMTPSVVSILERVDAERVSAATALGAEAFTACEWLAGAYGIPLGGLYDMLHANPAYRGILGPHTLAARYLTEDVPTGLVPIEAIARAFHVHTPAISALIDLAGCLLKRDFRSEGRNLSVLGLERIRPADYAEYFNSGTRPDSP